MDFRRDIPPGFGNSTPLKTTPKLIYVKVDLPPSSAARTTAPLKTTPKLMYVKVDLPTSSAARTTTPITGMKRPAPETEPNKNRVSQKWWRRRVSATKTKPSDDQHQPLKKKSPASPTWPATKNNGGKGGNGGGGGGGGEERERVFEKLTLKNKTPAQATGPATKTGNGGGGSSGGGGGGGERERVVEKLRLFRARCKELSRIPTDDRGTHRVDFLARKELKREDKIRFRNPDRTIGPIPGVEVGDRFHYRVELTIIGLHCMMQNGIDYTEHRGRRLATCVVATEGYPDNMSSSGELIYSGEGGIYGASKNQGQISDQKLQKGNLALKNSMEAKTDVRVVRGLKLSSRFGDSRNGKITYVYDGLYRVTSFLEKRGPQKNRVFEFKLTRQPGQPPVAWNRFKLG